MLLHLVVFSVITRLGDNIENYSADIIRVDIPFIVVEDSTL